MRPTTERIFIVPGLATQSDAILIHEAMESTPAVLEADISLAERSVRVVMGDIDGEVSVRRHLTSAGFPPED